MRGSEQGFLLLLCKLGEDVQPLRPAEYRQLSKVVPHTSASEGEVTAEFLHGCGFPPSMCSRIVSLLDRADVLARYLASAQDVTVLTRLSDSFPFRLRRLRNDCPPVLFCKGDPSLLSERCISLVGSRALLPRGKAFAERIGLLAAQEGFVLVSGGAAGADRAAQEACLAAGGRVVCFVPDALQSYPMRENLLLCSDEGYEVPFSAARALRRNTYIHALGEKVFVAQCPQRSGGTWAGATDNLRRGLSEIYVLRDGSEGSRALLACGANPVGDFPASLAELSPRQLSIFD